MNVKTLIQSLDYIFKADVPAFIWGRHGVGKSSVIKQWCNKNDWKLFDFRLNTQADVGDFLGLMDFVRDDSGNIYATKHFTPQWLVDCIDFCKANPKKGAVVFLDELNRAARFDMVGPVFQMSLDKRLHTVSFPDNLKIVVASNPNTEDYNVLNLDDKALLDRFMHLKLTPTKSEFFAHCKNNDVDSSIVGFLLEQPEFIESSEVEDFSINDIATPSRRTWADYINRFLKIETPTSLLKEFMKGLVGTAATTAYFKYLDNDIKALTMKEVLNEYPKHQQKMVGAIQNEQVKRTDVFKATYENLKELIDSKKQPTKKELANLTDFILDSPSDYAIPFLREIAVKRIDLNIFSDKSHRIEELHELIKAGRGKKAEETK